MLKTRSKESKLNKCKNSVRSKCSTVSAVATNATLRGKRKIKTETAAEIKEEKDITDVIEQKTTIRKKIIPKRSTNLKDTNLVEIVKATKKVKVGSAKKNDNKKVSMKSRAMETSDSEAESVPLKKRKGNLTTSYEKQLKLQQDVLAKVQEQANCTSSIQKQLNVSGSKKKSPSKGVLREQLKQQLEIQQQLLRMQQEIFEKANKAQSDIFKLLSELNNENDENDDSEEIEEEHEQDEKSEEIEENEHEEEIEKSFTSLQNMKNTQTSQNQANVCIINDISDEIDKKPQINDENSYVLYVEGDDRIQIINSNNLPQSDTIDVPLQVVDDDQLLYDNQTDDGMMVLVQNDNEESEAYELLEVFDPNSSEKDNENQLHFEIIDGDSEENMRCRVVPGKMQAKQDEKPLKNGPKVPIKVVTDLDAIPLPAIAKKEKPEKEISINKVLNRSRLTEKESKEFIQKMVHEAIPDADGKFKCTLCNEMVSNRYSLGPHIIRVHSRQRSKICPYCDRAFACTGDLTRHIRIHTNSKPFKCQFEGCEQAFRASGDLHKHMRRHEQSSEVVKRHICDLCNRGFERNYDLNRHKLTHNKHEEGVGFTCEICSMVFVRKDQYKAHTYRHLGIKPYKCPDCGRLFGDFSNCSKHIKQNACRNGELTDITRNGQYVCDICDKHFISKAGMKQHVLKCSRKNSQIFETPTVAFVKSE